MNAKRNEFSAGEAADILVLMHGIGARARAAATRLANAATKTKDKALHAAAAEIRGAEPAILAANALDVAAMRQSGATSALIDRGTLNPARVAAIADSLEAIAALPDPVGTVMAEWDRPNGLHIERVRTPLGVIGVIFESRPNVTADAGGLSLKAGNAVILRGGSDTHRSSAAIHACLVAGLRAAGLPEDAVQLVPTTDRAAVGAMLTGLDGAIDVIVPRGGRSLVARVQEEARVPVFAHLEGVCHVYVHAPADLDMAKRIVVNAKMRRTGVCGAAETLLVDKALADEPLGATRSSFAGSRLRDSGGRGDVRCGQRRGGRDRGGLVRRISRRDHRGPGCRWPCGCRSPCLDLRIAPHRCDRHRRHRGGRAVPRGGRFGDRTPQCLDSVR